MTRKLKQNHTNQTVKNVYLKCEERVLEYLGKILCVTERKFVYEEKVPCKQKFQFI